MKYSDIVLEAATLIAGADAVSLIDNVRPGLMPVLTASAGLLYSFGGWLAAKGY